MITSIVVILAGIGLLAAPTVGSAFAFKDLRAIWLPYVSSSTQDDIYCDQEVSSDMNVLHLAAGVTSIPSSHNSKIMGCPATLQAVEVFSVHDAKMIGWDAKAKGYDAIAYDLESGNSPSNETGDPVAAFAAMKAYVKDTLFLKLWATPSKAITDAHAADIAPYVDRYHIQSQSLQDSTSTFSSYIKDKVDTIKAAKSSLNGEITFQVSLTRDPPSGVNFVQLLKNDLAAGVSATGGTANGASIFFANNANSTGDLDNIVTWWHCNYTGGGSC